MTSAGDIKLVNCAIKQSGKKSPTKCCKRHLNIYTSNMRYINAIPILLPLLREEHESLPLGSISPLSHNLC